MRHIDQRQLAFVLKFPAHRPRGIRPKYEALIDLVRETLAKHGRAPTYGEMIAAGIADDRGSVRRLVVYGERRGEIVRGDGGLRLAA